MMLARHVLLFFGDLIRSAIRSGNWWIPVVIIILAVSALIVATAKVVVPTTVYVLF